MLFGCKIVIMNFEGEAVLKVIQSHKVTSMLAVATMLNYLIDVPGFENYDVSSIRLMAYG